MPEPDLRAAVTSPTGAPPPASAARPTPLYDRDELLRLCAHADEAVIWWAAGRLGADDGLIAVLAGPARTAAHVAAHVLSAHGPAPSPEAVRAAWGSTSEDWRPVLAALAARAGWVQAAEQWASRVDAVAVEDWWPVAEALLPLQPAVLAGVAADAWARADTTAVARGGLMRAAATSAVLLPHLVVAAWGGSQSHLRALGQGLLVGDTAAWLAEAPPVPARAGRRAPEGPPDRLRQLLQGWSAATPPPWQLLRASESPTRDMGSCRAALRRLAASLPPARAGLGPAASYLDGARRRCLEALAAWEAPPAAAAGRGRQAAGAPYAGVWALGVSVYAAIGHPVDWWGALADPAAPMLGDAPGLADRLVAAGHPAGRSLALLSCLFGDPPPWYPRLAARRGAALASELLREITGESGAPAEDGPDGEGVGATRADLPQVLAQRLYTWGARAAFASLAQDGNLLSDVDADRLYKVVDTAAAGVTMQEVCLLGRFVPPGGAARYRRRLEGDGAGESAAQAAVAGEAAPAAVAAEAAEDDFRRRHAALQLLQAMPWAEAGTELAATLPRLITDRLLWPDAATCAMDTGSPEALRALLALWRPGDQEIGDGLLRMAEVEQALGRACPEGILAVRADAEGRARAPAHDAPAPGSRWSLRAALQCAVCRRVHVYDVRRINVLEDPSPSGAGGATRKPPAGLPPGIRWGRPDRRSVHLNIQFDADLVPAPRFVCRACGAGGRGHVAQAATSAIAEELQTWQRLHDELGCPAGEAHGGAHGAADPGPVNRAGQPAYAADWHDHVYYVDPLPWGPFALSMRDLLEEAEARVADGRFGPGDLVFLAQQWTQLGDLTAARTFAERAIAKGERTAALSGVRAQMAQAAGDLATAVLLWQETLALAVGAAPDPAMATTARGSLRALGAPVPVPAPAAGQGPRPAVRREGVGRNDPCPCGSGKKYKRCHGA